MSDERGEGEPTVDWLALLLAMLTMIVMVAVLAQHIDFLLTVGSLGGCVYLAHLLWRAVLGKKSEEESYVSDGDESPF